MVDVGDKAVTRRRAVARATLRCMPETARMVADATLPKGDAIATARVAAVMAAKRTPDLVPLCHPLPLTFAGTRFDVDAEAGTVVVEATVETTARTGVEMEALTAVSVAALNVYDLVKGIDKGVVIDGVRLLEKTKGPAPAA